MSNGERQCGVQLQKKEVKVGNFGGSFSWGFVVVVTKRRTGGRRRLGIEVLETK